MELEAHYFESRKSLREPIPELLECAWILDRAVGCHLQGDTLRAGTLFAAANMPIVRDYAESLWGAASDWPEQVHYKRLREVPDLPRLTVAKDRMPSSEQRRLILERDGFSCRFCEIPVIPAEVRKAVARDYPEYVQWGRTNFSQHAGFQALWLQFDHVVPASFGGSSDVDNIVVTCAGCNYCKWHHHIAELGLEDPRDRAPIQTSWDGLTRYLTHRGARP